MKKKNSTLDEYKKKVADEKAKDPKAFAEKYKSAPNVYTPAKKKKKG